MKKIPFNSLEELKQRLLTPPTDKDSADDLVELMYSVEETIEGGEVPEKIGPFEEFRLRVGPYLNAARVLLEEWENVEQWGASITLREFVMCHLQDAKGVTPQSEQELAEVLGGEELATRISKGGELTLNEERALAKVLDVNPHCFYNIPNYLPNIRQARRRDLSVWAQELLNEGEASSQAIHVVIPPPDTREALETLRYLKAALLVGANIYHSPVVGGQLTYALTKKDLYRGEGRVSWATTQSNLNYLVMNTFEYVDGAPANVNYQTYLENLTESEYTGVILYINDLPTLQGLHKGHVHCVLPDVMGHGDRRMASLTGEWDLTKYSLDTLYHRLVSPKTFLQKEGLIYPRKTKE